MFRALRKRRWSGLPYPLQALLTFWLFFVPASAAAIEVKCLPSASRVHVGESISVGLDVVRDPAAGDQELVDATLSIDAHWRAGGKAVGTAKSVGDLVAKRWQFDLIAHLPGTTKVIPIVYLASGDEFTGAYRDSLVAVPVSLVILPEPGPARWPWLAAGAAALAVGFRVIQAIRRRRRRSAAAPRELPSPLEEALQMLDEARVNMRIDRADRYFADVERICIGYLTRRLERPLPAMTPAELAALIEPHVSGREMVSSLRDVLTRCAATRFSGARGSFEEMEQIGREARSALEHLDIAWRKK
jgi:hypothetical protein